MKNETEKEKKKRKPCYFWHDLAWALAYLPGLLWFRPKNYYISDKAKQKIKGGALIVANHVGFYDPVYMMMSLNYRRQHFVATKELFSTGFKKFIFEKIFLCIRIDRESTGASTLKSVINVLKQGEVVSMFPEGHINFDNTDTMAAFKSGVVLMALKGGCPIVPMYIRKRKNIFRRQVTVYGEPVTVSLSETKLPVMEYINKVAADLREKEIELEEFYKNKTKKKE